MSATPTVASTLAPASEPSLGVIYLSVIALIILFVCVVVAFEYGRRMQRTSYDVDRLKAAVKIEEKQRLLRKLEDDKWSGPLDATNHPLPFSEIGGYGAYYYWQHFETIVNLSDTAPSNQTEIDYWKKIHALKVWGLKEQQIWNEKNAEIFNSNSSSAEKKTLLDALNNRSWAGPIDNAQNPFPTDAFPYNVTYFWEHKQEILSLADVPPNNQAAVDDWKKLHALKVWGNQEQTIYDKRKQSIDGEAGELAKKKVPKATDIIQSGGLTFVLEFCTIMVIIFTLVILGILGVLPGNEISAILAAIAGYVLGRAATSYQAAKSGTSQTQSAPASGQTEEPPAQPKT
jgi:hypothetical protein